MDAKEFQKVFRENSLMLHGFIRITSGAFDCAPPSRLCGIGRIIQPGMPIHEWVAFAASEWRPDGSPGTEATGFPAPANWPLLALR